MKSLDQTHKSEAIADLRLPSEDKQFYFRRWVGGWGKDLQIAVSVVLPRSFDVFCTLEEKMFI
jgi:hypothetical protein